MTLPEVDSEQGQSCKGATQDGSYRKFTNICCGWIQLLMAFDAFCQNLHWKDEKITLCPKKPVNFGAKSHICSYCVCGYPQVSWGIIRLSSYIWALWQASTCCFVLLMLYFRGCRHCHPLVWVYHLCGISVSLKNLYLKDKDTRPMNGTTFWFPLRYNNNKLKIIQEIEKIQWQKVLELNVWVFTRHDQMSCNL